MLFNVGSGDDVCLVDGGRVDDRSPYDGKMLLTTASTTALLRALRL
jgi:hypothetical protein